MEHHSLKSIFIHYIMQYNFRKAILETDPRHEFQSMELMLAYFYVKTSGKDNSNLAFITPAPGAKILDLKQLATLKNLGMFVSYFPVI